MFRIRLPKISIVVAQIDAYVQRNRESLPILEECCFENGWDYDEILTLYNANFKVKRAINALLCKKAVNLEKYGAMGTLNKAMAVHLLERLDVQRATIGTERGLHWVDALIRADYIEASNLENDDY